jgi:hypothetical protein
MEACGAISIIPRKPELYCHQIFLEESLKKNLFILFMIVLVGGLFFVFNQPIPAGAQQEWVKAETAVDTWTFGVTSEGSAAYSQTAGRLITNVASFRANQGENEIYFIFPAAAEAKSVQAASVTILSREGTLPESASLTLKVVDLDGDWQQEASLPLDAMVILPGNWVDFTLSDLTGDLQIQPGQVLVAQLAFSAQGDLDIKAIFDIEVE